YPENHDPSTESSECLYLILTEPSLGNSIVADIDRRFIRDSDSDGLPEFVDAWGKPLRFIRWPTDYYAFLIDVTHQFTTDAPDGLLPGAGFDREQSAASLFDSGLGDEALLYATNWLAPEVDYHPTTRAAL